MKGTVSAIKKPFGLQPKKDGTTFGPCMLCEFELENGETATAFVWKEIAIGEEMELFKKGEFWNVVSEKQQQQDDTSKMLNEIYKVVTNIESIVKDGKEAE
jgi:hypothetical protein